MERIILIGAILAIIVLAVILWPKEHPPSAPILMPSEIEVKEVEERWERALAPLNIPTYQRPISEIFVSHTDSTLAQGLQSVEVTTTPSSVIEIFVSHVDASLSIELLPVVIPTEVMPLSEIFISHADSSLTATLEAPSASSK